ncbi:uncharacterized protein LOC130809127 isoform X1 [Amaranthus tricolor]|uniref:uncharacterized protein LOC130809127 isoform X1 n=1 Tax=Amaranthus tricolor TaxID=29722 RepID=UPI002586A97D|nr:uncharacterized protein LOC130809127 isoform X1 [Amaranthus tricolor]
MDSLSSVSPSIMLPPLRHHLNLNNKFNFNSSFLPPLSSNFLISQPKSRRRNFWVLRAKSIENSYGESNGDDESGTDDVEVDEALRLDGTIPGTSDEFVKQVSSRAYDIRRHLHESLDSSSYDVLDANPWRETSKPVYVLTQKENQLCTMKTRMNRSEVERELGLLFSKGKKWGSEFGNQTKQSRSSKRFQMVVEDVREGILVFEDQNEAVRYCDLMQGGGQGCEGVAEIEASSVFDLCRNSRALAVLFRRGRTPPQPESLQLNLRARKRSLED